MQKLTGNKTRGALHFIGVLVLLVWSGFACADIIDDINLKTGTNGDVEAIIRFTVPIQNLRYAKQQMPSTFVAVYFNILDNTTKDQWQNIESHRSPPSDLIPGFTITTHDLNMNPKIEILFNSSADFTLKAGRDGRSLVVHIKSNYVKQEQETKPVAAAAIAKPAAAAVTTAAALAAAATPSVAAPTTGVAAAAKSKPTVVATAKPVESPATPAPAAPVVAPAPVSATATATPAEAPVVVAPSLPVPIPKAVGPLGGGKEALPAFPKIDEVTGLQLDAQPVVGLTLAEQIKRADSQAALQMAIGRNAILTGDMSIAVESFNNVLKLSTNKYTQDAQVWIGIAREKSGQPYKAVLEYDTYTKLYPNGASVAWAKNRLAQLKAVLPDIPTQQSAGIAAANTPHTAFQTTEYGSLSMYYYTGSSKTDTVQTVGAPPTPSLTSTDQSSLLSNVNMTARSYNNVYDNRLVFQEFNSTNFLQNQPSQETLNAFYYDVRNRIENYSVRVGRQSSSGGGVMGRFDGANAGYGVTQNTRVNVVAGQLSDKIIGPKPVFFGASVDLGVRDMLGGSVYAIKQTVSGLTDREAVGGYMRYAEQGKSIISMLDYDAQFRSLNTLTVQGTMNSPSTGMDYNFLLDHRRAPTIDIRNSVIGTSTSVDALLQNGFTQSDLIELAKKRTATSNIAMIGANKHLSDKWQAGGDFTVSSTSGLPMSGTCLNCTQQPDGSFVGGTPGLEGFMNATPSTGAAWTTTGRLIGNDIFTNHDISIGSLSYTKSNQITGEMFLLTNHSFLQEKLTMDSTLRLYLQTDINGGTQNVIAPVFKFGYRVRNSLTVETEEGIEWTKSTPGTPVAGSPQLQGSTTLRKYFSLGGRWDF